MTTPTPKSRTNQPREERLLAEYLARFYPKAKVQMHVRLGNAPLLHNNVPLEPAERKLLKNFSRHADALIVEPDRVTLVEAKVIPSPGSISEIEFYGELFGSDDDYKAYASLPLRLLLVWGFDDPVLRRMALKRGIAVELYSPDWLGEALRAKFPHHLRATRPSRQPDNMVEQADSNPTS